MANEVAEIENVESSFATHEFNLSFITKNIRFEVVKMNDSTFIWIGQADSPNLSDLSFGIPPTASINTPITTKILGIASTHTASQLMAERLCKRLKKPVFVSLNADIDEKQLLEKVHERLIEEIGLHSEHF